MNCDFSTASAPMFEIADDDPGYAQGIQQGPQLLKPGHVGPAEAVRRVPVEGDDGHAIAVHVHNGFLKSVKMLMSGSA
eukprot:7879709-Pyramimonas_sp.AAC.1